MFGIGLGGVGMGSALNTGGGWSPLSLGDDLLAWWTADRADLITLSGSQVTHWLDVVAGYEVVQALGSSRPVYSATGFNGAPGLTFDSVDDYLHFNLTGQFPAAGNGSELWAVCQQAALAADTSARCVASYGDSNFTADRRLRRSVTGGVNRGQATVGTGAGTLTPTNTTVDLSSRHLIRAMFGAATTTVEVDGGGGASSAAVPSTTALQFAIGSIPNGLGQYWNGKVRDILVAKPLSTEKAAALAAWALPRRMF